MTVQSVVFVKRYWNEARAKKWLRKHKYKGLAVDEKPTQLRFRQEEPDQFRYKRTKKITKTISFIVGFN